MECPLGRSLRKVHAHHMFSISIGFLVFVMFCCTNLIVKLLGNNCVIESETSTVVVNVRFSHHCAHLTEGYLFIAPAPD